MGAARIAPNALIIPAKSHSDVIVAAVAARDIERAEAFAKKHGIDKVFGGPNGYQGTRSTISNVAYRCSLKFWF